MQTGQSPPRRVAEPQTARVSVVLIFFEAERFLDEAIRSVVAQTFDSWELLLVDDGSTDGSAGIARRWAATHPTRIRYLSHEGHRNLGMSAARHLGLQAAGAELVTFLDADDVLQPDAVQTLAARLEAEPRAVLAYAPIEYWYSWDARSDRRRRDFVQDSGVRGDAVIEPPDLLVRFLSRSAACPSGIMVRTSAAREVGGFEQAFRGMYEDQAFCAKICRRWPVATVSTPVYRYRQHPGSSSAVADRSGAHEYGRAEFLHWLQQYLGPDRASDRAVRSALRRELWWLEHPRLQVLSRELRRARRRMTRGAQRIHRRLPLWATRARSAEGMPPAH